MFSYCRKYLLLTICCTFCFWNIASARDVSVKGYYRSNGTYVQPHIRSAPDSFKYNNYGPSRSSDEYMNPRFRDNDRDGTPNYIDTDDDNDGIPDEVDRTQY